MCSGIKATGPFYLYLAEGSIAAALNIPLTIAMLATPHLRKRRDFQALCITQQLYNERGNCNIRRATIKLVHEGTNILIIGISIADAVFGLSFVISAINRLNISKHHCDRASEIHRVPRWTCTMKPHVLLLVVAYQLQGVLPLAVAIDRILAIMIPTKYMRFNFRYTIIVAAGPYVFVAIATIIEILISRQDGTKVSSFCLTVTAVSPGFHDYTLLLRIVCVSISALIYLVLISRLNKHIEKAQINGVQIGSLRRSTITVGLSTVNAVIFLLIPDIIKYLAIYNDSLTHIIILYSLSMTNVDLNALIFGFRHREIVTSMRRFFCALLRCESPNNRRTMMNAITKMRAGTIVITSTATKKRIIPRRVAAT